MSNLNDKDFGENFLHQIKEKHLLPKPKWQFLLKNFVIWSLGIFSLVLGAASMSLIFYMMGNDDAGVYGRAGSNLLEALSFIIPFFWVICLAIFATAVYFYVKHTKKGYKYSTKKIILIIVGASLILGGIFNAIGLDRVIDDILGERAPFYDQVINPRLKYWSDAENGRLTGLVTSQISPLEYELIDRQGEDWVTLLPAEEADDIMVIGYPVMLVGKKVDNHKFMIKEVLPVGPGRGFFKRPHPSRNKATTTCKNKACDFIPILPPDVK